MKNNSRVGKMLAASLIIVLVTGLWAPPAASAQGVTSADPEAFRARLAALMQDLNLDAATKVYAASQVEIMSPNDLMLLQVAYPKDSVFWNAPRTLEAFLKTNAAGQQSDVAALGDEVPCPVGFNYEALWIARTAEMVADIAMEVIPEDAFTSPAYIVAAVAWAALKVTLFAVEQKYERWDDCETGKVFDKMDASVSSRATQTTVDGIKSTIDANVDATISSRASQDSLTGVQTKVTAIFDRVETLVAAAGSGSGGPVTLFSGTNFTGTSSVVGVDQECFGFSPASVQVPAGTTLILYTSCRWEGISRTYTSNDSNVSDDGWTSLPFSFKVIQPPPADLATQAGLDSLGAKIDALGGTGQLATRIDALQTTLNAAPFSRLDAAVSSRATQASVSEIGTTVGILSGSLDATVSSRASQTSVSQIGTTVGTLSASLDATVSSRASQLSVNVLQAGVTGLQVSLDSRAIGLETLLGTRATQASVDDLATKIGGVSAQVEGIDFSGLAADISTRATQTSVDAVQSRVTGLQTDLTGRANGLDASLATRAAQSSVDQVASSVTALGQKIDGIDLSELDAGVSTRASQTSVDALKSSVVNLHADLTTRASTIDAAVATRASEASLAQVQAALSTKATQASVDAGLVNILTTLQQRFDHLASVVALQSLQIQVVEVRSRQRYLVYVTDAGRPVSGAALARMQALAVQPRGASTLSDITASATTTEIAPGMLEITLNLPRNLRHEGFVMTVTQGDGPTARVASAVFHLTKSED